MSAQPQDLAPEQDTLFTPAPFIVKRQGYDLVKDKGLVFNTDEEHRIVAEAARKSRPDGSGPLVEIKVYVRVKGFKAVDGELAYQCEVQDSVVSTE